MHTSYLIGVDAGVSFVKVAVYDPEGNSRATIVKSVPGEYPKTGVFLQSADVILGIIKAALREYGRYPISSDRFAAGGTVWT